MLLLSSKISSRCYDLRASLTFVIQSIHDKGILLEEVDIVFWAALISEKYYNVYKVLQHRQDN